MDAHTSFEIKAEAFRRMTGHMAPGKDAAAMSCPESYEVRREAWDQWLTENGECINAMLLAAESVLCING